MNTVKKWYQKASNWILIVICLILIPVLVMNISIMYQANTNKDEVPSVFGYKPFIVLSGSMETEIKRGDLIIVEEIDSEILKVDDVIAFRDAEDTVTTHRIIEIIEKDGITYFITKGDNNDSQDQNLVELGDVEGIYIFRIPGVGTALNKLAEPTTIIIVVLGITAIFGIAFAISTKKQREEEQKEFLEYKKMKEDMEKAKQEENKKKTVKKNTSAKKSTSKKKTNDSKKVTKTSKK